MATVNIHQPAARQGAGGIAFFSAGFRPFFLLGAAWAAIAVPVWLAAYTHGYVLPGALPAMVWHAHEMIYGYALAAVTGFLLTAIPNWTGRLPLRGVPLAGLVALWLAGRVALLASASIGPVAAALIDLAFTATLIAAVARELIAARSFHNLPVLAALVFLFTGNLLVHLHALDIAYTASLGNRVGVATLVLLVSLIGGRIVPSFTRNWLAKRQPKGRMPVQQNRLDVACLLVIVAGLVAWTAFPEAPITAVLTFAAGVAAAVRLSRWRGLATLREPLLFVLHAGYAWVAVGLVLLAATPGNAALHALTVGAIGTMTLAVMTRATLGHSGRPLAAGPGTWSIYLLVTLAAILRTCAALSAHTALLTSAAGVAWSAAFILFAVLYGPLLIGNKKS